MVESVSTAEQNESDANAEHQSDGVLTGTHMRELPTNNIPDLGEPHRNGRHNVY